MKAIEGVQAIMLVGQTGNMGGYAVADVLTAKTIPSGKLTDTWARSYEDYPSSATFSHRVEILTTNITVMESMWDIVILIRLV